MSFDVKDCSNSTDVVSTGNIGQMSWLVANPADNLILFQIILDGISFVDVWMWESDGSSIVSNNVWDFVWSNGFSNNFAEFEVSLFGIDFDQGKSTFFIIQKSVIFTGFNNGQHIHDTNWELSISSNFIINSESCLFVLSDDGDLLAISCISEAISEIMRRIT